MRGPRCDPERPPLHHDASIWVCRPAMVVHGAPPEPLLAVLDPLPVGPPPWCGQAAAVRFPARSHGIVMLKGKYLSPQVRAFVALIKPDLFAVRDAMPSEHSKRRRRCACDHLTVHDAPLRAALIGYGYAGRTFHAPLLRAVPGWELACVASSRPDAVQADLPGMRVVADALQSIAQDGIDVAVIATPNPQHAPLAEAALRAGKHVVVDKPFTLDLAQARQLRASARRAGRVLSVFHNRRWDSDFLGMRQLIDGGRLGQVVHFESHFDRFRPQVRDRWRERAQAGGGIWFDLGPHLADQALQLFGLPLDVHADIAALRSGAQADDWAHVVLRYERLRVILHAGMLVAGGSARFTVHGTRGSAVKPSPDRQEAQLLAGMRPGQSGWGVDEDPIQLFPGEAPAEEIASPAGDQRLFYAGLRDAIRAGRPAPVTDAQALAVMAVLEAGVASARSGCTTRLALSDEEREAFAGAADTTA